MRYSRHTLVLLAFVLHGCRDETATGGEPETDASSASTSSTETNGQTEASSGDPQMVRLEISPSELAVDVGQRKRVQVTAIDATGVETDVGDQVEWLTDGDTVVTVDGGFVRGVATGDAELRVVFAGIESEGVPVRVRGWSDAFVPAQSGTHASQHFVAAGPGGKAAVAFESGGDWRVHTFEASNRDSPWSVLAHEVPGTIAAMGIDAAGMLHLVELADDTVVHAFDDGMLVESTSIGPGTLADWSEHELRFSTNRNWAVFRSRNSGDVNRFQRWGASTGWEMPLHINYMHAGKVEIDDEGRLTVVGVDAASGVSAWRSTPGQADFDEPQVLDPEPELTHHLVCLSLSVNGSGEGVALWHTPMGPKLVRLRDGRREGNVTFLDFDDDVSMCHACGIADDGRALVARTRGYPAFWIEAFRWDEGGSFHHDLTFEHTYGPWFTANAEGSLWMFARHTGQSTATSWSQWLAVRHDSEFGWQEPQPTSTELDQLHWPQVDVAPDGGIIAAFRHGEPYGSTNHIRAFVYH